jgi:hypothetical protein
MFSPDSATIVAKGDLARHSPPSNSLTAPPLRKRHATYERNPNKTPGKPEEATTTTATAEGHSAEKVDEPKEDTNPPPQQEVRKTTTSIDELMRSIFMYAGSRNPLSTTGGKASGGDGGHKIPPEHSKPIVKSMSDVSCDKKLHQAKKKPQQSVDDEKQREEEDGEDYATDTDGRMDGDLEIEENQATVGHGRGEWVKQLVEESKGKKERAGGGGGGGISAATALEEQKARKTQSSGITGTIFCGTKNGEVRFYRYCLNGTKTSIFEYFFL